MQVLRFRTYSAEAKLELQYEIDICSPAGVSKEKNSEDVHVLTTSFVFELSVLFFVSNIDAEIGYRFRLFPNRRSGCHGSDGWLRSRTIVVSPHPTLLDESSAQVWNATTRKRERAWMAYTSSGIWCLLHHDEVLYTAGVTVTVTASVAVHSRAPC